MSRREADFTSDRAPSSRHRVAVVVFCDSADPDPEVAVLAVRKALAGGGQGAPLPYELPPVILHRDGDTRALDPVTVHDVLEVGVAAGNGYLWQRPTVKAYRAL